MTTTLVLQPLSPLMSELTDLDGLGVSTASKLENTYDVNTVDELANTDPDDLDLPANNEGDLIAQAQRRTIQSQSAADRLEEFRDIEYRGTGVEALDAALGGGWEAETIAMTYGSSGQGKTQLALSSSVQAAAEGPVSYIQTEVESKSVAERLLDMAGDSPGRLDNIYFYEALSVDEQYQVYEKALADHEDISLVVVDSFTALFRLADEYSGRNNLGERASEIGRHLQKLREIAKRNGCPVLLTGQVYPNPEAYGRSDLLYGGEKMRHFISYFVRMSSGEGELVEGTVENHPGRGEQSVTMNITDDGIEVR